MELKCHYIIYSTSLDFIQDFVYDKKVLDIGCVGKPRHAFKKHKKMVKGAKSVVGIDINSIVSKGKSNNYILADATVKEDMERVVEKFGRFEVIIMSELIEHIGNLSMLFDNLNFTLEDEGRIILTTPNAISNQWVERRALGMKLRINAHHICWFDEVTLSSLVKRSGLKIEFFIYTKPGGKFKTDIVTLSPKIGAVIRKW